MWLTNIDYRDRTIENEQLELSSKDALYALGPNLVLRDCRVIIRISARNLLVPGAQMNNCTIKAKQELKNFRWYSHSQLKGCRFTGKYSGNDFGRWPDGPWNGSLEDCDFTEARLDACRFIGCDVSTLRFPRWPHFTLLDTYARHQELSAIQWPGDVGCALSGFDRGPVNTVAITNSATVLAKRYGVSEESIKVVVERLDGVIF